MVNSVVNRRRRTPAGVDLPEGAVRVLESHHAVDFRMALDHWPFHKIGWVAVGKGTLESVERGHWIEQDDFLLLPAGWPHRFIDHPGEPLTLVILCISRAYLTADPNPQRSELWARSLGKEDYGEPRRARTAFHRSSLVGSFRLALREQENQFIGWETALQSVADRLLLDIGRNFCPVRERHTASSLQTVQGAVEYMDQHLCEALRIDEMAERCQLSVRRFTDLFKQLTSQTFSSYLNRKRIEFACQRLKETGHILYACHESGFNDLAYFYRVFKKETGQTPGEFMRSQ